MRKATSRNGKLQHDSTNVPEVRLEHNVAFALHAQQGFHHWTLFMVNYIQIFKDRNLDASESDCLK